MNELSKAISINNVSFSYRQKSVGLFGNNREILSGVSFDINRGETFGIIGRNGAGKSSIINLMGRFYEFQKGSITIDGIDIRRIDPVRQDVCDL